MRPCDCVDEYTIMNKLSEQGLKLNSNSIEVTGGPVILEIGPCVLKIPRNHFKRFAEWYLEDQSIEK